MVSFSGVRAGYDYNVVCGFFGRFFCEFSWADELTFALNENQDPFMKLKHSNYM